jgi:hypothetical protein
MRQFEQIQAALTAEIQKHEEFRLMTRARNRCLANVNATRELTRQLADLQNVDDAFATGASDDFGDVMLTADSIAHLSRQKTALENLGPKLEREMQRHKQAATQAAGQLAVDAITKVLAAAESLRANFFDGGHTLQEFIPLISTAENLTKMVISLHSVAKHVVESNCPVLPPVVTTVAPNPMRPSPVRLPPVSREEQISQMERQRVVLEAAPVVATSTVGGGWDGVHFRSPYVPPEEVNANDNRGSLAVCESEDPSTDSSTQEGESHENT